MIEDIKVEEILKIRDPEDFSWIKVKRHVRDSTVSPEEQYQKLEEHHIKETQFLLDKCRQLARLVNTQ